MTFHQLRPNRGGGYPREEEDSTEYFLQIGSKQELHRKLSGFLMI